MQNPPACQECGRRGGVTRELIAPDAVLRVCRYCGAEWIRRYGRR